MANHTPGPWCIARQKSFHYSIHTDYVHDRGHDCNIVREVRCEANARLMAAAPDLLEALQCAATVLILLKEEVARLGCNAKNVLPKVQAAIRKAEAGHV